MDEHVKEDEKRAEELFFDGERYYTREEFFASDEDDDKGENRALSSIFHERKWIKVTIASLLSIALLMNILAFWPRVYNVAAIQFLIKSNELSKNELVQQYKQAIVVVSADGSKGTGFNIASDGRIITNHHVVSDEQVVYVQFHDGKKYEADVIENLPDLDIAVLAVRAQHEEFPTLNLDFTDITSFSEESIPFYVIGNPLFFNFIANEGEVAGTVRLSDWHIPLLVLAAPIYKGNSGSPVITEEGKVIGVVFATTKIQLNGKNTKVGLAVPMQYIEQHLN